MTGPVTPVPASAPGAWQATHVFYAANPRPFLLQCVRPLVAELEADGLIDSYFFINYWLEGPHVRLRLKPSGEAATPPYAPAPSGRSTRSSPSAPRSTRSTPASSTTSTTRCSTSSSPAASAATTWTTRAG